MPLGYTLKRDFDKADPPCTVVAPSLIPVRHGDRIKTDRRDARKLGELLRADLLTEVQPPTESEEAVRDVCRCREDAQLDLARARYRLNKFLVRRRRVPDIGVKRTGIRKRRTAPGTIRRNPRYRCATGPSGA
jgi:hypothetical protein